MHLKITNENGQKVLDIRSKRKRRILYLIQANKTKDATYYIKTVGYKNGTNDGQYSDKAELKKALNAFTED
jgi:hypothetical protein